MRAMIFAAGRGRRMMPMTLSRAKPMLCVRGKPLIEHNIAALRATGIRQIVINISHRGANIRRHLGGGRRFGVRIHYSDEGKNPLETAGGIIRALPKLGGENFIAINGDVIFDYDLRRLKLADDSLAHLVLVKNPPHHPRGDFALHGTKIIHRKTGENLTFSGIGIYRSSLFQNYAKTKKPLPLLSVFEDLIRTGKLSGEYFQGFWRDIGTPAQWRKINRQKKKK